MRRADDPRLQPIVWIVIVATFVVIVANADSRSELLAQAGVFAVLVGIYAAVVLRRR